MLNIKEPTTVEDYRKALTAASYTYVKTYLFIANILLNTYSQ